MADSDVKSITMLDNASASSAAFSAPGNGWHVFEVVATWGGGTVKLTRLGPDGSTYIDCGTDVTFTADGQGLVWLFSDDTIIADVVTATAIYAKLRYAPEGL